MKQYKLKAADRALTGRGPTRRLRGEGKIPAVIYGPSGSRNLSLEKAEFRELWKEVAGASALIQICEEDGQPIQSLIQEVQRDPVTDEFVHIDFKEISVDKEVQTHVAVHIVGEAVGVKNEGGLLEVNHHELRVRCLPRDLPPFIEVNVIDLHVGAAIHVSDLESIPGVSFEEEDSKVIASCVLSAASVAEERASEETGENPSSESTES